MNTLLFDMTKEIDPSQMEQAGKIVLDGGLVAFPTETVYGLGGNALDPQASMKIYAAKGRPSDNPLIVHIADWEAMDKIVTEIPEAAKKLANAFWPGPLTMILNKSDAVPMETTGGLNTVAIRMPNHPVALGLIRNGGGYIAAPSANTSGRPSPSLASHVYDDLNGKIDCILDGGMVDIGVESTIIDLTEEVPVVLRPGYISLQMLRDVLGHVEMDRGLLINDPKVHPKAPGMKYRHYAPKAALTIVEGPTEAVIKKINELAGEDIGRGEKVGIIATSESSRFYSQGTVEVIGTRSDEITISRHLFAVLRSFDDLGVTKIYSESFETPQIGQAIMNRLIKAAGHQIITVS